MLYFLSLFGRLFITVIIVLPTHLGKLFVAIPFQSSREIMYCSSSQCTYVLFRDNHNKLTGTMNAYSAGGEGMDLGGGHGSKSPTKQLDDGSDKSSVPLDRKVIIIIFFFLFVRWKLQSPR